MTPIRSRLQLEKPTGDFTILVGDAVYSEGNLFTNYGLNSILTSGAVIFDTTSGGLFKYCRIGRGNAPITKTSNGLDDPRLTVSVRSATTLSFYNVGGRRYAQQTSTYTFAASDDYGLITEVGLYPDTSGNNMLCGKTLEGAIPAGGDQPVSVVYTVRLPIFSQFTTIVGDGSVTTTLGTYAYTLDIFNFEESANRITCVLPVASSKVTGSAYSTFIVNGVATTSSDGAYTCITSTTTYGKDFEVTAHILGSSPVTTITSILFGYSSASFNCFRLLFSGPTYPVKEQYWSFKITFTLSIEWLD